MLESIASSRSRRRLSFSLLVHDDVFDRGKDEGECFALQLEQCLSATPGNFAASLDFHILDYPLCLQEHWHATSDLVSCLFLYDPKSMKNELGKGFQPKPVTVRLYIHKKEELNLNFFGFQSDNLVRGLFWCDGQQEVRYVRLKVAPQNLNNVPVAILNKHKIRQLWLQKYSAPRLFYCGKNTKFKCSFS